MVNKNKKSSRAASKEAAAKIIQSFIENDDNRRDVVFNPYPQDFFHRVKSRKTAYVEPEDLVLDFIIKSCKVATPLARYVFNICSEEYDYIDLQNITFQEIAEMEGLTPSQEVTISIVNTYT